jgi:hypothetical protein
MLPQSWKKYLPFMKDPAPQKTGIGPTIFFALKQDFMDAAPVFSRKIGRTVYNLPATPTYAKLQQTVHENGSEVGQRMLDVVASKDRDIMLFYTIVGVQKAFRDAVEAQPGVSIYKTPVFYAMTKDTDEESVVKQALRIESALKEEPIVQATFQWTDPILMPPKKGMGAKR